MCEWCVFVLVVDLELGHNSLVDIAIGIIIAN